MAQLQHKRRPIVTSKGNTLLNSCPLAQVLFQEVETRLSPRLPKLHDLLSNFVSFFLIRKGLCFNSYTCKTSHELKRKLPHERLLPRVRIEHTNLDFDFAALV